FLRYVADPDFAIDGSEKMAVSCRHLSNARLRKDRDRDQSRSEHRAPTRAVCVAGGYGSSETSCCEHARGDVPARLAECARWTSSAIGCNDSSAHRQLSFRGFADGGANIGFV